LDGGLSAVVWPKEPASIELREVVSGRLLARLDGRAKDVKALTFSRDGMWLASAGPDALVIWDVRRARLQASLGDWLGPAGKGLSRRTERGAASLVDALRAAARAEMQMPGLLKKLKDDSFEVREEGSHELQKMGRAALPAILRARKTAADLEVKLRLDRLMKAYSAAEQKAAEKRWVSDAVTALKQVKAAAALKAVGELARSSKDTVIGQQAGEALKAGK